MLEIGYCWYVYSWWSFGRQRSAISYHRCFHLRKFVCHSFKFVAGFIAHHFHSQSWTVGTCNAFSETCVLPSQRTKSRWHRSEKWWTPPTHLDFDRNNYPHIKLRAPTYALHISRSTQMVDKIVNRPPRLLDVRHPLLL